MYNLRLYYFTSAQFALNNIALSRIKISLIKNLNDPYELSAINMRDPEIRKAAGSWLDGLHKKMGMVCFSSSYQSPLMWGHYADKHAGICLGFDVLDDWFFEVKYIKDLLKFDRSFKLNEEDARKLLSSKHEAWSYENECRVFIPLKDKVSENGIFFEDFSDEIKLAEVILGPRCDIAINTVTKLTSKYDAPIHVKKARLAFTDFKVVENRAFRRS